MIRLWSDTLSSSVNDPASQTSHEGAVRAAEERAYAQLFEASPFPAVLSRLKDGTVIAINERTAEVIGVAPADAVGQLVTTYYVDPSQRDRIAALIASEGRADDLRLQIMRRNREPL